MHLLSPNIGEDHPQVSFHISPLCFTSTSGNVAPFFQPLRECRDSSSVNNSRIRRHSHAWLSFKPTKTHKILTSTSHFFWENLMLVPSCLRLISIPHPHPSPPPSPPPYHHHHHHHSLPGRWFSQWRPPLSSHSDPFTPIYDSTLPTHQTATSSSLWATRRSSSSVGGLDGRKGTPGGDKTQPARKRPPRDELFDLEQLKLFQDEIAGDWNDDSEALYDGRVATLPIREQVEKEQMEQMELQELQELQQDSTIYDKGAARFARSGNQRSNNATLILVGFLCSNVKFFEYERADVAKFFIQVKKEVPNPKIYPHLPSSFRTTSDPQQVAEENPDYDVFPITAFGVRAKYVNKYANIGDRICIEGYLKVDSFVGKDGRKRLSVSINANKIELLYPQEY